MYIETFGRADDRPVLLLHGGGVGGWMWNPTVGHMTTGARFIVPDLPGHDHSADQTYQSHDQTVSELIYLIEKEATTQVAVVGFSLGAQLAVLLASRRPDLVERVAVVSAQAKPSRAPALTLALLAATANLAKHHWFAKQQAKALFVPAGLMTEYLRTSSNLSKETLLAAVGENMRFSPPPEWPYFPGMSLILAGERERDVMQVSAQLLHNALRGSRLAIIDGCGHGIPLQRPRWFAERICAWLREPPV
ncbi:alpha/beta hydrolase [Mycolicibacterium komossense]|uniref:Alpha/beta hydrolase n=1 Tax=Mycolicibacterium komossense TaxID=1779 RepID=A0ABT3CDG8_9MYCO|nr:alpha/beta hydrolase [Mycolicibacterium komossense]